MAATQSKFYTNLSEELINNTLLDHVGAITHSVTDGGVVMDQQVQNKMNRMTDGGQVEILVHLTPTEKEKAGSQGMLHLPCIHCRAGTVFVECK